MEVVERRSESPSTRTRSSSRLSNGSGQDNLEDSDTAFIEQAKKKSRQSKKKSVENGVNAEEKLNNHQNSNEEDTSILNSKVQNGNDGKEEPTVVMEELDEEERLKEDSKDTEEAIDVEIHEGDDLPNETADLEEPFKIIITEPENENDNDKCESEQTNECCAKPEDITTETLEIGGEISIAEEVEEEKVETSQISNHDHNKEVCQVIFENDQNEKESKEEVNEPQSTEEPEEKDTVEPEEKDTVEPEEKDTVEPEEKDTVEPEEKDAVEPEEDEDAVEQQTTNTSFSNKISNFFVKLSPVRTHLVTDETETSSSKKNENELGPNAGYYARITGRPGLKSGTPDPSTSGYSKHEDIPGKTPVMNRLFNDSFGIKSEPPRVARTSLRDDQPLRKFQAKRCLNAEEENEENEEGFLSRLSFRKRRKVESPTGSSFFETVLRTPFKKRKIADATETQPKPTESRLSWLLAPFWWRKSTPENQQTADESKDESTASSVEGAMEKTEGVEKVASQQDNQGLQPTQPSSPTPLGLSIISS